jgi:pilus assembly protein CpaF
VERALREEVWEVVGKLLDERRLLAPRPEDEDLIRGAVRECVVAYQRRAAAAGEPLLPQSERLEQRLFDRLLRLGPLEPLMRLEGVEEILVNGPWRVLCVQHGHKRLVPEIQFEDDEELRALVKRIVGPLGKRLDEGSPMVDVRLPDGSRLHAVIPPAASRWTCVTIRRFVLRAHSLDELVALDTLSPAAAGFLDAAVQAGVNIVVSGGTAGGKTTLVNALGASIASDQERICTVEDTPELTLDRILPDCVALQARPGNVEGAGEIRIRDLVRNALRMRPSRIVVGEVRGPEALDMLQAMNTGHEGSLSTVHANSARDALDRLVTLATMAEEHIPAPALMRMVARTIQLVVHLRYEHRTGRRRVARIFEVTGQEGDVITGNDLWELDPAGDRLRWTGIQPRCLAQIADRGVPYSLPPAAETEAVA